MQEVELAPRLAHFAVRTRHGEGRDPRRAVHRDEFRPEVQVDAVFADIFHQRRDVVLDPEQHRAGVVEFDLDVVAAVVAPVVGRQIHGLLRGAGAFDRHGRLGEDRPAAAHRLHQLPGVGRSLVAVVGGDVVASQGFGQARDGRPVQLQPRRRDQHPIADPAAVGQFDAIMDGVEGRDRATHPLGALGDQVLGAALGPLGREDAGADHGPAGLIVVMFGRLHDANIEAWAAAQEAGGRGDAGGSAADDQDIAGIQGGVLGAHDAAPSRRGRRAPRS